MMLALFLLFLFLIDVVAMFLVMPNVVGWWSCKQHDRNDVLPYNFRIYFGPNVYFTWLEKREGDQ